MDTVDNHSAFDDDSLRDEARALSLSIEIIRRARGRRNPRDCRPGTDEWTRVSLEFVGDLRWALGLADDETSHPPRTEN